MNIHKLVCFEKHQNDCLSNTHEISTYNIVRLLRIKQPGHLYVPAPLLYAHINFIRERSGSVVECLA